jgi:glycosyltransferase involved in cell wall biosynthesis
LTDAVRSLHADVPVVQIEDTPLLETFAGGDAICADALRQRYGLASAPVVLYTGNLESYQGVDLLFDALPSLAQHCPSARVLIVGGEQAHVDAAMQQLAQRGLADRVVFAGRRPTAEMPAHMAMAQALVSPRTNGTNTPLKLYSYMHAGVPIVATDLPTHTQVLDSECAVLCAPEAGALGRALANVLLEPEKFGHLGAAARERVLRDYSATEFRRKLLGAYGAVLSLSRSATARSA